MTTAAIKLKQLQEDANRKDIFATLNESCIQPTDSAAPAARAAAAFAKSVKTPDEDFFWRFWGDVFDVAEQVPHDHPAQDRLVVFVRELMLAPETGDEVMGSRVWIDLPALGAVIRERLDRPAPSQALISFHAFVARLLHAGVSPGSETTAIWMLRAALEQDDKSSSSSSSEGDFDRDLTIAAVYVEYSGATLVQTLALSPEPKLDEVAKRMLKGGPLWTGESGLTPDRWNFWGKRFREQADKASAKEVKELALHAARLIEVWTKTRLSSST